MADDSTSHEPLQRRRLQFSIGSMFLWAAIMCLTISNVMTRRELVQVRRELDAQRPLTANEVARQFEERTTRGPISVTVRDVRYSPEQDSYKIDFSFTDATSSNSWTSDVRLRSDGYGTYYGEIRADPFVKALGFSERFVVSVKTRSPLHN